MTNVSITTDASAGAPGAPKRRRTLPEFRVPSAIPGFGLTYGFVWLYLSIIILIPLGAIVLWAASLGPVRLFEILTRPDTFAALKLSFGLSLLAAGVNAVFGLIVAWVLTRYSFPGRRLLDAAVDLPFALPTAVAGIALTAIYAQNGWVGAFFAPGSAWASMFGPLKIAYTPLGIFVALVFIGLPFVVRTLQPVLVDLDKELEEASATLGANRGVTLFKVVLPTVFPALLTGFALAFARAVGEYGSVIFIAGNIPGVSEIAPLLIITRLEQFDYAGATAIATAMLALSFVILLLVNFTEAWSRKRLGHVG